MVSTSDRYNLVVRNLQEVVGDEELRKLLAAHDNPMTVYWGTATTGRPHVAYFVPIIKLADMLRAGCKVVVLFADLHAYLDNMKAPWSLLRLRTQYYEAVIKNMLISVNVPLERLTFVRGADFQLTEVYAADLYRLMSLTSVHDARKAGAEVVKQVSNPLVSGLLYPLLQALDEVHLRVDAQFGGVDQRKIFMLAEKYLPHMGEKKRVHLMNPMVPGLTGAKMSSSEADSKIDLLDSCDLVRHKLALALCAPGKTADQGNGLLAFLKYVVFPLALSEPSGCLSIGTNQTYTSYEALERDFLAGLISAETVKQVVTDCLNARMDVVRAAFATQPDLATLVERAYPNEAVSQTSDAKDATVPATGWFDWLLQHRVMRTLGHLVTSSLMWLIGPSMKSLSISPDHPEDDRHHHQKSSDVIHLLRATYDKMKPIKDKAAVAQAFEEEFPGCLAEVTARLRDRDRLRCLWTITPDGLPHLGHSIPLRKLARLSQLDGVHIVVLVRNVAAHLRGSIPWDLVVPRGEFCRTVVSALFNSLHGRSAQFTCILGSEFQCGGDYMLEFYRIVSLVPETDCAAASDLVAGAAVPQQQDEAGEDEQQSVVTAVAAAAVPTGSRSSMGELLLPCADLVDTVYLEAHVCVASPGRCEKRRLFEQRFISHFDHKHASLHLTHSMLSSLQIETGTSEGSPLIARPMQACSPSSRGSLTASAASVSMNEDSSLPLVEPPVPGVDPAPLSGLKRRLKRAFCQPGNVQVNPVLELYRYVVLPDLKPGVPFVIARSEKNGGPLLIDPPEVLTDPMARWRSLEAAFAQEMLHPGDLKPAVEHALSGSEPDSITARLAHALPPWSVLLAQLDAAFPRPAAQAGSKTKTKAKKSPAEAHSAGGDGSVAANKQQKSTPKKDGNADELNPNRLDIRVGRIVSARKHPDADSLYVEEVDFGTELGTRTVVSGLAGLYPLEQLEGLCGVFVTNLKPVRMRGIESQAMLLCASHTTESTADSNPIRVVRPIRLDVDETCTHTPGTRLVFHSPDGGAAPEVLCEPDAVVGPKTKLWDRLSPDLALGSTPDRCVVWRDWRLGTVSDNPSWVIGPSELPVGSAVR